MHYDRYIEIRCPHCTLHSWALVSAFYLAKLKDLANVTMLFIILSASNLNDATGKNGCLSESCKKKYHHTHLGQILNSSNTIYVNTTLERLLRTHRKEQHL